MNPSATGWIPKFLTLVEKQQITAVTTNEFFFYNELKNVGFIYGISIETLLNRPLSKLTFTTDEYTKINLFHTLLFTFFIKNPQANINEAIEHIISFYKTTDKGKTSFFKKLSLSNSSTDNLEGIISARLQESNTISKNKPSSTLTYSLLFIDVLAFKSFLNNQVHLKGYIQKLESDLINFCFLALKSKNNKEKIDFQIIELLESSSAYLTINNNQSYFYSLDAILTDTNYNILEKKYIFDLCCLAIWDDKKLDASEVQFLKQLTQLLNFSENDIVNSIRHIEKFSEEHSKTIKLFEYSNHIQQFYKNSAATVKLLIIRNKNRLIKELEESGELVKLLGQSTLRELTTEEKDKVKEQLIDICKSIPSLTIFLIPGGSLLLPLLVKYIPSLLPSAFQENRIENKNNIVNAILYNKSEQPLTVHINIIT